MTNPFLDPAQALRTLDPHIVGVCTGEGDCLVDANEAFVQLSGYSLDELRRGDLEAAKVTPPEWFSGDDATSLFSRRHGYSRPYLRRLVQRNGTTIDIIITGAITAENPRRWLCFVVDVTTMAGELGIAARSTVGSAPRSRRSSDDMLPLLMTEPSPTQLAQAVPNTSHRATLASVLDAAPTGALLLGLDAQALHVTPTACAVLGMAQVHWLGARWRDLVHPDDRTELDAQLLTMLGGRKAESQVPLPVRFRHGRGHWHQLDVHAVLVAESADCVAVLHLEDRLPRRRSEREAQRSDQVRQIVLAGIPDRAVFLYDLDLRCLAAEGDLVTDLCAAAAVSHSRLLPAAWAAAFAGIQQGYEEVWSIEMLDGRAIECRGTPLRDDTGVLSGLLVVARPLPQAEAPLDG